MLYNIMLILISLIISIMRILGFKSKSFQSIAHLFTGFLIGVLIFDSTILAWGLFLFLCVVEVICFYFQHFALAKKKEVF